MAGAIAMEALVVETVATTGAAATATATVTATAAKMETAMPEHPLFLWPLLVRGSEIHATFLSEADCWGDGNGWGDGDGTGGGNGEGNGWGEGWEDDNG